MFITYSELFSEVRDSGFETVAGHNGLCRVITGCQIAEIEDEKMLPMCRQLIFTAGVGLTSDDDLLSFVRYACDHDASGVVMESGKFIDDISSDVKAFSDEKDFPVLVMPYRIPVGNVTHSIESMIEDRKQKLNIASGILKKITTGDVDDFFSGQIAYYGYDSNREYFPIVIERDEGEVDQISVFEAMIRSGFDIGLWDHIGARFVFIIGECQDLVVRLEQLKNMLGQEDGATYSIGTGPVIWSISDIRGCVLEAAEALDMIRQCHKKDEVRLFENTGVYRLFFEYGHPKELQDISDRVLSRIVDYDSENGTELEGLIEDYLDNRCNLAVVSRERNIPRNTVRYQIDRAAEVLGVDLKNVNDLFTLRLAFKIRKYLNRIR